MSHGTANVDATRWLVDEVMPIVWRTRPDVHLYLVGESPAPAILARRGPRVHVTQRGPVDRCRCSCAPASLPSCRSAGSQAPASRSLEAFANGKTPR